MQPLWVKG